MKREKYCQSCGMPLNKEADFGTEKDGVTRSLKYCVNCYENGEWTSHLEFDEMYELNLKKFQASDMSKMQKFFLNKMYTKKYMKKLERWQNQ